MTDSEEERLQNQFGGFCVAVLRNENNKILRDEKPIKENETSLYSLPRSCTALQVDDDQCFKREYLFEVMGKQVPVSGRELAEGIGELSTIDRELILLSYFLGLTDREIAEIFNIANSSVCRRRMKILSELRNYFEKEGLECKDL